MSVSAWLRIGAPLAFLAACFPSDEKGDDTYPPCDTWCDAEPWMDVDGDGYFDEIEDCDDAQAAINPGVDEACDGVDNNCDGLIDEQVTTTYYRDEDDDGFGDPLVTTEACAPSDGWVEVPTDCDDTCPTCYPDAEERCDEQDNDCDTEVDEGLSETLYADEDRDGYGDAASPSTGCEPRDGEVTDSSDCDDADALVHPGATEICGDGADQDCDDADPACTRVEGEISASSADAELMGGEAEFAGARVCPAGDANGDGVDDLWVGLYAWGPSDADYHGSVMLVFGPVSGAVAIADVAVANLYGAEEGEYAGWDMSRGEDLDGDGQPDLAIGAYGRYDGSVNGGGYVVYGPFSGTTSLDDADGLVLPDDPNLSNLGYEISSSPDLTGDDVGDVVLGSYGSSTDDFAGAAWVVQGPVDGTVTLGSAITISGVDPVDLAGNGLDGVGDVNGDGLPDLVVGAHGDDTAGDAAGAAGVFFGPLSGDASMADADRLLTGEVAADEFSRNAVNGRGDVDGDGTDDLLIGAMFASPSGTYSGAAYLFTGDSAATGTTSASAADAHFTGEAVYDIFGRGVDIGGDVDADGHDDVLVSGQGIDDGGGADTGAACLYYGPLRGSYTISSADAEFEGTAAGDGFGITVAGVGDTNADGRDDVLVGAWFNDDNGDNAGAAYLFAGG